MKKKSMVVVVTIAVFACLLLCTPALADYNYNGFPVETRVSGTVNGGVFIDYEPWDGTTNLTGNFDVPNGDVKWACLYVGAWGGSEARQGWVNVTFKGIYDENGLGPIHLRGEDDTNPNVWCSGHGKHWMFYNVTNLTTAGSTNIANYSVINGTLDPGYGGRCYGIVLVVVYEGGDNPKYIKYWINDGSDGLHAGPWPPAHNSGTTYFDGTVDIANVTRANLTMVHLTAYEPGCDSCLKFNGHELDTSMVDSNTFELNSWDVTDNITSAGNNAWYSRGEDGYVSMTNAILLLERETEEKPDLSVISISPNCDNLFGNESNEICSAIENNGTADAGAFNVSFSIDSFSKEVRVDGGLTAGENITVCVTDTTLRNAGDSVTITVTADCNGEVAESDVTNNEMTIPKTVVNNGYKGKRYTGGNDLETLQIHTLKGNIVHSTGDSYYLSSYSYPSWTQYAANWNASDSPVPMGAGIEKARLYVYYTWDKKGIVPEYISLAFNGHSETPDAIYMDSKGYGSYNYPSGMLAYDVTADFNFNGNTATLTNSYPGGGNVSMQGMLLTVIYADSSEPERTIWINEECDLLYAKSSYCTTPEEATAYAPFAGTIDLAKLANADLITVAPSADKGDDKNRLYFNDHVWNGTWDCYTGNNTNLGINETDVGAYLNPSNNLAKFQDNGDSMEASNAFLVITYKEAAEPIFDTGTPANPYPSILGTHEGTITPEYDLTVSRMYTYPCSGTGGHSEYVEIWNATGWTVNASWKGYKDDWHIISFDERFTLEAGKTYNYTIRTGSYPQIHHTDELEAVSGTGTIRCTKFVDANGKEYNNWIPAIKLY